MSVRGVAVISVPVSDQGRAKKFFVDQMGFELKRDDASVPGMRWILVAPPGGGPALTLVDWFDSMPAGSLRGLVFSSTDIEADYQRLSALGVEFDTPPETSPWGTETVFRDPDGNRFVLQQA